jgi:hypothetical protein
MRDLRYLVNVKRVVARGNRWDTKAVVGLAVISLDTIAKNYISR